MNRPPVTSTPVGRPKRGHRGRFRGLVLSRCRRIVGGFRVGVGGRRYDRLDSRRSDGVLFQRPQCRSPCRGGPGAGARRRGFLSALAGTLNGDRQVENAGDPDGKGFASAVFDDGTAHFYFNVSTPPSRPPPISTAAPRMKTARSWSIHPRVSATALRSPRSGRRRSGTRDPGLSRRLLLQRPQLRVPAGAVSGQLRATETVRVFPVISRASGQAGSEWRTRLTSSISPTTRSSPGPVVPGQRMTGWNPPRR